MTGSLVAKVLCFVTHWVLSQLLAWPWPHHWRKWVSLSQPPLTAVRYSGRGGGYHRQSPTRMESWQVIKCRYPQFCVFMNTVAAPCPQDCVLQHFPPFSFWLLHLFCSLFCGVFWTLEEVMSMSYSGLNRKKFPYYQLWPNRSLSELTITYELEASQVKAESTIMGLNINIDDSLTPCPISQC